MTTPADIVAGLKTCLSTELGAGYSELKFGVDVDKNKFNGGYKGYAVLSKDLTESEGVFGFVTVDQDFEIILTETYATSQVSDTSQRETADTLSSRLQAVYLRAVRTKAATTAVQVSKFRAAPHEFIDSNTAVLRGTVTIKYRNAL